MLFFKYANNLTKTFFLQTGPRKYKRRRKLKPHEIERLRYEQTDNGGVDGSDIDISDFDMDNVDDLLGIPETSSTSNTKKRNKQNCTELVGTAGGNQPEAGQKKQRYNSTGSNSDGKLNWQTKLINSNSNDETYKSLLSNLENTLQSIDTLVVGGSSTITDGAAARTTQTAQRTQHINLNSTGSTNENPVLPTPKSRNNKKNTTKSSRPRMIHTERTRFSANADASSGSTKRRSKTLVTRSEPIKLELMVHRSTQVVNDYEIISPEMHLPKQISSSPVHNIKQENNHHDNSEAQRNSDLYDAQLLLEATALRKEAYEKYNPNIVNDLEEILRSPDKSDKSRHRFTSESSTAQFLAEQSEEEQNIIKIEPTSPDIHDIVVGASRNSNQHLNLRSTRRRPVSNRKYLEFETEIPNNSHVKSSRNKTAKSPKKDSRSNKGAFSNYSVGRSYENVVTTSPTSITASISSASSFSSIAAVVSAANAVQAISEPVSNTAPERKQRYFECEMCSAVFPDRAQLLDHVPIHI